MRKMTLSAGLAAMVIAGAAYAQPATPGAAKEMTRAEAQQMAERAFERMDVNRDGVIDQQDRAARQKAQFDRLDTDKSGTISLEEFTARRDRGKEARAERGVRGERNGHRGMAMHRQRAADGTMTKESFVGAALERFDRADANKDGKVSAQERQAMRQTMRQQRQAS